MESISLRICTWFHNERTQLCGVGLKTSITETSDSCFSFLPAAPRHLQVLWVALISGSRPLSTGRAVSCMASLSTLGPPDVNPGNGPGQCSLQTQPTEARLAGLHLCVLPKQGKVLCPEQRPYDPAHRGPGLGVRPCWTHTRGAELGDSGSLATCASKSP